MKKLWVTFLKDAKLSFNGLYFYIEIGMALIFIAIMLFVVPENFDNTQNVFMAIEVSDADLGVLESLSTKREGVHMLESRVDVQEAMKSDRSSIGTVVRKEEDVLVYEMILQGYESERMINLMQLAIESTFNGDIVAVENEIPMRQLEETPTKLTNRQAVLPVYIAMNVGMMGLFIIAAYIFLDKEEGVIKAYAVAPVNMWQYLASKLLIMLMMGIITSVITFLAIVGTELNYLYLLGLMIAFNLFGSSLGLFIASFFNTMVKAMGAMYAVIMIMLLPAVSYFMPAFNPIWIRVMPSYPMMFSIRDLISGATTGIDVLVHMLGFLVIAMVLFVAANHRFKKSLTV